jgi:trigger factor
VLAAVVEAEDIEPSHEDLIEALAHSAEHEKTTPEKLLERLREGNRLEPLRRDLASRQAVTALADSAQPISVEQAKARDKLWTPGKDEPEGEGEGAERPGKLWTPG